MSATPLFADGSVIDSTGARVPMMLPIGVAAPDNPTHVVSIELSTGATVVVGTVGELLRLLREMINDGVYYIFPTENLFILRAGPAKLLLPSPLRRHSSLPLWARATVLPLWNFSAYSVFVHALTHQPYSRTPLFTGPCR